MQVEEIIKQITEQKQIINNAQKKQDELFLLLITQKDSDWDMISVSKAVQKSGLSASTIYRLINSGKIKVIHKGSLNYISNSELEKYNGVI